MARKKRLIKKERKSWYQRLTSWTLRLLVVLVVLSAIAVGMLSLLAGTGDMQRRGLQQAMTQMTGMKAEIGELAELKVLPHISVEMRNVTFKPVLGTERVEKTGDTKAGQDAAQSQQEQTRLVTGPVKVKLDRARVELSIWHLLFGSGVFNQFEIEDLHTEAGMLGSGEMVLETGAIEPANESEDNKTPVWAFDGEYAGQPLSGAIGLKQSDPESDDAPASYYVGGTIPLDLAMGDYRLRSVFDGNENGAGLRDLVLKHQTDVVAKGSINWRNLPEGEGARYTGALDFGKSRVTGAISEKQGEGQSRLGGNISFAELHADDLSGGPASLTGFAGFIGGIFAGTPEDAKPQPVNFGKTPLDLDVVIARLVIGERTIGHINMPVRLNNDRLHIAPLSGELTGGELSGDFVIDAGQMPAELGLELRITDSNYTTLQKALGGEASVKGQANLDVNIDAKGKTWPALLRNMNGYITLLAGRGELASNILNIWGGGLLTAMIPDFSKNSASVLNCAVGHFKLKNSMATAAPLFLDTKQVTITGAGTINLRQSGKLNLVLTPNAKQTAPFDVATAVNVTGPFDNPYITPNMISAAGKVGGLVLGTVNPAFLAFSMTDFGFTDSDPCQAFLVGDGSGKARQSMPAPTQAQEPDSSEDNQKSGRQETGTDRPLQQGQTRQTPN